MKTAGKIAGCAGSLLLVLFAMAGLATAQQEKVISNFDGSTAGGQNPNQGLVFDSSGNLYGTTAANGTAGQGIVFELMPQKSGKWIEKKLYQFQNNKTETYSCLIFDSAGNLYTNVELAGANHAGETIKLTPAATGEWTATVLHTFNNNGTDGADPDGCLTFDSSGNLYGATFSGGAYGWGTVFELTPTTSAPWTETILHSFNNVASEGGFPNGGLIFDSAGNLYGTARGDTLTSYGCVFEFSPSGSGWTETVLHTFSNNGTDGTYPEAGLILDSAGDLYGTTEDGGAYSSATNAGGGTVFELSAGTWTETLLHSFNNNGSDGAGPAAALVTDSKGNLYGTTEGGGLYSWGTVFELTPVSGGGWNYWLLHSFSFTAYDGASPFAGVILDASGNLYGTAQYGGNSTNNYDGIVFEISPY
jgi:uncharacterized repeat protein (TIGR03803 family)